MQYSVDQNVLLSAALQNLLISGLKECICGGIDIKQDAISVSYQIVQ
jgi:hypothetical protein